MKQSVTRYLPDGGIVLEYFEDGVMVNRVEYKTHSEGDTIESKKSAKPAKTDVPDSKQE